MEIRIDGFLDAATLKRALRVHFAGFRLAGIATGIAGGMVFAIALPVVSPTGLLMMFLASCLLALPYGYERRRVSSLASAGLETRGTATDKRIVVRQGAETFNEEWAAFHQAKVLAGAVILYRSSIDFCVISRSFMSSDESWSAFVAVVRQGVPRQHRSHTVPWLR